MPDGELGVIIEWAQVRNKAGLISAAEASAGRTALSCFVLHIEPDEDFSADYIMDNLDVLEQRIIASGIKPSTASMYRYACSRLLKRYAQHHSSHGVDPSASSAQDHEKMKPSEESTLTSIELPSGRVFEYKKLALTAEDVNCISRCLLETISCISDEIA